MSAVFGILHLDGRHVEPRLLDVMSETLAHRGCDDVGIWKDEYIGFGHRMSWTTKESKLEKLPHAAQGSHLAITADARIDNRRELIEMLSLGHTPAIRLSDSELILTAYERWGEDCADKILGDFVFAIWDSRANRLFCARDSMGVKHFYYYHKPMEVFAFASEIKALLELDFVPHELNEEHIGDILILNYNDKENTPYKDIRRLPANNAIRVDRFSRRQWQYWHPSPKPISGLKSDRDYEEAFRDVFRTSVESRMRSVHKVGSMLSGGLDSSAISCVAAEYLASRGKEPLETFSAIFPEIAQIDPRIDERDYIDSVANHIKCSANYVEADAFSPLLDMEKMHWHADHPIGVPNVFMDWALFKAAQKRDVKVLLSGFDGDSVVSYGYESLSDLARQGSWFRLFADAVALNRNMPHRHHSLKKLLWKQGFRPAIPERARRLQRAVTGRPEAREEIRQLPAPMRTSFSALNPSFVHEHDLEKRFFEQLDENHPEGMDRLNEGWNALCNGLFAFALETFEKTAAAFDVEPRFPFFDRRLIEFCLALPAKQKLLKGWTRSILRRSMEGILPQNVQWRTDKANIGLSFKVNLLKYGRKEIDDALSDPNGTLAGYIDLARLRDALERYKAEPLRWEREPMLIISSVYLSNWLRHSFDRQPARAHSMVEQLF